ncbi:MAG: hypothetical protein DRP45_00495 [Candidatus Zixiibacteriota bacterium]|nr:MAG: hypothetical protein DRP45_00495 [candidate division Zixibacteria bacterium]
MSKRAAIVLAAGQGKRMKSDLPKVLHTICGRSIIKVLLDTLTFLDIDRLVVVIGHKGEMVQQELADYPAKFAWQKEQLGTAHAVKMAADVMADFDGTTLVAAGDVPFLSRGSIERLFEVHESTGAAATCLSAIFGDPKGYGRIVRDGDSDILKAIVEHKDADEETLSIAEINTGTFCFDNRLLFEAIEQVGSDNAQQEFYLTDAIKILHDKDLRTSVVIAADPDEVRGINSAEQLKFLEKKFADRVK